MRRTGIWITATAIVVAAVACGGVWTWRVTRTNHALALALEADRQRNFNEMAYHVEQIQALLAKGLVTGSTPQNMRYMSGVHLHAMAAVSNFNSLPLPTQMSATTGKFLQQTGDFALSLLRNEAAGREMDARTRSDLARLRVVSTDLSAQFQNVMTEYNRGGFRWNPPLRFSWSALLRGTEELKKPATGSQAPGSISPGGWEQLSQSTEHLPVMIYDGPFSDHVARRTAAVSGPPVTREEAGQKVAAFLPGAQFYRTVGMENVDGNLPSYSFRLAPASAGNQSSEYTTVVEITRFGGYLSQMLNSRPAGRATIDLTRAKKLGQEYLTAAGYRDLDPTYGQVTDGTATIAYAAREHGVILYPDQAKVKVALDNGEVLAVDARQYLLSHHVRRLPQPALSSEAAQRRLHPDLKVRRVQLTLIPNTSGTGEIMTYEFLTTYGDESYLVYINAQTGVEEQLLQLIETDGGTFTL